MSNIIDEKFLVTGAGGFVGGHLVTYLKSQGQNVRALVRNANEVALYQALGVDVVVGDLRDFDSLKKAVAGISGIYHIAAMFRKAGLPDQEFYDINVTGTKNLLDIAIANNVKRFIHCSTVGVHGHVEVPPANEDSPFAPGDHYQKSKLEGEELALSYFKEGLISGTIIRPAMIYGPGDMRTLKLFSMVNRRTFFYVGDGSNLVHFIDVRDLAKAFYAAMCKTELNAESFIIAGKSAVPLKQVTSLIATELGVKPPWIKLPIKLMQAIGSTCEALCKPFGIQPPIYRRRVDFFTKDRSFNSEKAARLLGFVPEKELQDVANRFGITTRNRRLISVVIERNT